MGMNLSNSKSRLRRTMPNMSIAQENLSFELNKQPMAINPDKPQRIDVPN